MPHNHLTMQNFETDVETFVSIMFKIFAKYECGVDIDKTGFYLLQMKKRS